MDTNLYKETDDHEALEAFVHCPEFYVLRFAKDTFFTEIAGGRKLLWCCASEVDLAVIMKVAYLDRAEEAVICTGSMRWLMTEWAKDPTVEISFVWNARTEGEQTLLPFIAPVTRRGVLQHIAKVATEDKKTMQTNESDVLASIEALHLFGVLLPEAADSAAPLEQYIYADGNSGLRYLRWIKAPELFAQYKAKYPEITHAYKSIPDIIQCIEHHGLGGLIVEREDSVAVLTTSDLMAMQGAAHKTAPLTSFYRLEKPCAELVVADWLDFGKALTFSDCGFNLHTLHGSAVGALLMYCVVDNYINKNEKRQNYYNQMRMCVKKDEADKLLSNLVVLADDIAKEDQSLPTSIRADIHLLNRLVLTHGECSVDGCNILPMCDGVPFYEDNYRIYRMATMDYYAEIIRQGMLHLEDSEEDIAYYIDYAKSRMPDLMNEWAAAVSTAKIRSSHLVKVNGCTIHDAVQVVQSESSFFSVGRTLHDGYKWLVRLHRGDVEFPPAAQNQSAEKPQTIYLQIPEFTGKNEQERKATYIPIPTTQASSGFLYDLDDVEPTIDEMPHSKLKDESLCTYIMRSGDWFTFKVLDMKRAERSIYVYFLTMNNPLSAGEVDLIMCGLYYHPDILMEFGMVSMGINLASPVTVAGYTAHSLMNNTSLSLPKAYICLTMLRDSPDVAVQIINETWGKE